jgi:hypothetical protein
MASLSHLDLSNDLEPSGTLQQAAEHQVTVPPDLPQPNALLERAGVGSIPANPDEQNVPSFSRWRFEMKLSPF